MLCYGYRLREARESRGITRDDLAAGFGVTPRQVKHWEMDADAFDLELTDGRLKMLRQLDFPTQFYSIESSSDRLHLPSVFMCGPNGAVEPDHCEVSGCDRLADWLCDFHVTERRTCDRRLCDHHAVEFGTDTDPIDYCPAHAERTHYRKETT